ncbi:hypothetical protein EDD86DRAFT_134588 [Gorgonomyces haynaldii]|nr:hypothetical protein EDD86DRAFT_134588 [Gorgonomyces haynaldii]
MATMTLVALASSVHRELFGTSMADTATVASAFISKTMPVLHASYTLHRCGGQVAANVTKATLRSFSVTVSPKPTTCSSSRRSHHHSTTSWRSSASSPKKTPPTTPPPNTPSPTTPPSKTTASNPDPTTPPETTQPSCQGFGEGSCSMSTSTTSKSSCATAIPGRARYCACDGLKEGVADELFELYAPGTTTDSGKLRLSIGEDYVDELVVDVCYAARAALYSIQLAETGKNRIKVRSKMVSSVVTTFVNGVRTSAQGFSARMEGMLEKSDNPAYCAREREQDPTQVPPDPDVPETDTFVKHPNITMADGDSQKNDAPPLEGQCEEPHACKRLSEITGLGDALVLWNTVAVQMLTSGKDFTIKTIPRCDTCQKYSLYGDIPTDSETKVLIYQAPMKSEINIQPPPIPCGSFYPFQNKPQ